MVLSTTFIIKRYLIMERLRTFYEQIKFVPVNLTRIIPYQIKVTIIFFYKHAALVSKSSYSLCTAGAHKI